MKWLALLVVVSACGRIGFTERDDAGAADTIISPTCTAPGHDEDADGFADSCDPCPHIAGTLADDDMDGVGNACDPNPSMSGDRIVVFDPFTTQDVAWTFSNSGIYTGDDLTITRTQASIFGTRAVTGDPDGVLEVGLTLGVPVDTTTQRQFVLAAGDIDNNLYTYGELNQFGVVNAATVGVGVRIGNMFPGSPEVDLVGPLENRATILRYSIGPQHRADTTWPSTGASFIEAATPASADRTQIGFYGVALDTAFHYFIFIETP